MSIQALMKDDIRCTSAIRDALAFPDFRFNVTSLLQTKHLLAVTVATIIKYVS
jgi:hypothetical protein